jgi:UDP-N-acetylmuramoylalanine--D-glutamate ligase
MNIAILGLGRSGLAVAKAALAAGDRPHVFDAKPADDARFKAHAKELKKAGIEFTGGFDGRFSKHDFDQLVTSPGVDMRSPILREAQRNGIEVIGEIEFAYRVSKAPIIGITGTNGKSTTTVMTWLALKAAGEEAILCGNIWGSGFDEIPLTEAAMNSNVNQVLVAEISSFQLEFVRDFRPRCAGITNISPDHLNRYDNYEQYANTKRKLFDKMGEGDTIVANAGDTHTFPSNASLRDRGFGLPRVRFYGAAGVDASFDAGHLKVAVSEPTSALPFHEKHNLLNACHASLLALGYLEGKGSTNPGLQVQLVLDGLKAFRGLAHRMEHLGHKGGIEVINNSMCTNPAAIIASSSSVPAPQHLLIGGIKKNYDFNPVRDYLDRAGHAAYLFGKDALEINEELGGSCLVFSTMKEAFRAAREKAAPGEVVMLAPGCASMDQFNDFVARGEEFRKMAKEWLDGKDKD